MKASIDGHIVALSNDIIEAQGYQYFPRNAVRMDWLEKVEKTPKDLECPHGVQFYDVVVDGRRHRRAAPQLTSTSSQKLNRPATCAISGHGAS